MIKLLSIFKSSLNATYYCFSNNDKLSAEQKTIVSDKLELISHLFFEALKGNHYDSERVRAELNEVFRFLENHRNAISNGTALKIIRFLKDVHESMENTVGIKMHGTPISLRAYCLVFIYVFPIIFIPTLVHDIGVNDHWIVYSLAAIHGFILISLYNVQDAMEDPFDQIGLDDIQLDEFHFVKSDST
ncbi:MAG: hypothetical protein AB8B95_15575 [Pseudohongiellaceae bacterium]